MEGQKKQLIVKSNSLIEGFMNMNKQEYKFILYLISKIRKNDMNFRIQTVTVKEFADLLELDINHVYSQLEGYERSLVGKYVQMKNENGDRYNYPWFGYIKYFNKAGTIEVAFNKDLAPHLLQLDTNYTKYWLENVKPLYSQYSIRIYELLKQYEKIGERTIDIDDLRMLLGILPKSYTRYNDFKRKVLITAKEDINNSQNTDISFDFEEIKKSRKIVKIKFTVKSKKTAVAHADPKEPDQLEGQIDIDVIEILNTFKEIVKSKVLNSKTVENQKELDINMLDKLIQNKGLDYVKQRLEDFKKVELINIERPAAYFYWGVEQEKDYKTEISKTIQPNNKTNFEQRDYDDDFFNELDKKM